MGEVWYSHFETDDGLARQCRECGGTTWPSSPDPDLSAPIDHDLTCAVGAAERAEARVSFMRGRLESIEDESRLRHERAMRAEAERDRLADEHREMSMRSAMGEEALLRASAERDALREAAEGMAACVEAMDASHLWFSRSHIALTVRDSLRAWADKVRALAAPRRPAGSGEGA